MDIGDWLNLLAIIVAPIAAVLIGQWLQNRANRRKDKLCVENPSDTELKKIKTAQDKLLEAMAVSLGYKDKITWETIQNPYVPKGLTDAVQKQQEYQDGQLEWIKTVGMVRSYLESNPNGAVKAQGQHDPEGQS